MAKPEGYKDDEFIHFVRRENGKYSTVDAKNESKRTHPKYDMYEIPFRSIEEMKLDKMGENVPFTRSNVVNLERYILRYWQPILGSDAIMLLLNLWEYCNRDEGVDICYPKIGELATLMGRSNPTITNLLKRLEDNNFLIVIHRLNKLANNKETSPIFKLRQTVPLLSKDQYFSLPKPLRDKHDQYMDRFGQDSEMEWINHNSDSTFDFLLSKGDKIISKRAREEIDAIIQREQESEYLLTQLPDDLRANLKTKSLITALENQRLSKPSIEIIFGNAMSLYEENSRTAIVLLQSEDMRDYLLKENTNVVSKLVEALKSIYTDFDEVKYYTFKQYIYKLKKS